MARSTHINWPLSLDFYFALRRRSRMYMMPGQLSDCMLGSGNILCVDAQTLTVVYGARCGCLRGNR
jgi:hypothetical protein